MCIQNLYKSGGDFQLVSKVSEKISDEHCSDWYSDMPREHMTSMSSSNTSSSSSETNHQTALNMTKFWDMELDNLSIASFNDSEIANFGQN